MPGLDGHMVCDMLKKSTLTWSIPVIYMTAREQPGGRDPGPGERRQVLSDQTLQSRDAPGDGQERRHWSARRRKKRQGRILVIDQDLSQVGELEAKLKQSGYEVVYASTAAQGISLALESPPDAILLDFATSHADGHAAVKAVGREKALVATSLFILATRPVLDRVDPATAQDRELHRQAHELCAASGNAQEGDAPEKGRGLGGPGGAHCPPRMAAALSMSETSRMMEVVPPLRLSVP